MFAAKKIRNIASHSLLPELLPQRPVIIDAGANVGEFSCALSSNYGGLCYAIEPSPEIFERIPANDRVRKFQFALAATQGELELHVGANPVATTLHRAEHGEYISTVRVPTRALEEFCRTERIRQLDVLKMDIEGEELPVLASCSDEFLKGIGQVTVEFHEWIGQGSVADVKRAISRMGSLGFHHFNVGRTVYCDVLFVNRRLMSRGAFTLAWLNMWVPRLASAVFRRLRLKGRS